MLPPRLSDVPLLWVLAIRRGEARSELLDTVARLERRGARRVLLEGLSEQAVAAVVTDTLGVTPDSGLLDLAQSVQGNPFLLVELLHGLDAEGRVRVESGRAILVGEGLPVRVTESMRQRLDRLGTDAKQVAQVAAVLGSDCSAEQVAAMLERRPSALTGAFEELVRAGLLIEVDERLRFGHDLLRQAVVDTLPRSLGRALQREAASVLLAAGAAPVEVAHQLTASAEVGDREAIATLREAARIWAGSDVGAAADLSQRALDLMLPGDEEWAALAAETVILLHSAMRPDAARELGERALTGALVSEQEADVRLSLSRMFNRSTESRIASNQRALTLPGLAPTMRARHLGLLAYNLAVGGHIADAADAVGAASAAASETGDLEARVTAALAVVCIDAVHGRGARALERMHDIRQLANSTEQLPFARAVDVQQLLALASLGRVEEALALYDEGTARARRERDAWMLEVWPHVGCRVLLTAGRLADARAEAGESEVVLELVALGSLSGTLALSTLAQLAIHTGDATQLRPLLHAARHAIGGNSPVIRRYAAWVLALAAMARDAPREAVSYLRDDELPYAVTCMPVDAGQQPAVARMALAAGDEELARRAVEVAESYDRESPGMPVLAASAAQTRGLVERDAWLLADVARRFADTQRPLLFAEAAVDAGHALAREGWVDDAVGLLGEAFDTFLELGATADARRVGRVLRAHGVRRHIAAPARPANGWDSLTESERRVARLVAGGATNRHAAAELLISPHTVSSHLRSAYGKLAVTSRLELARIVLREDQGGGARGSE
jgi:DNA-binding CsgD family transcriptional regulator